VIYFRTVQMDNTINHRNYLIPLAIYIVLILLIFFMKRFISWPYVLSISALFMLSAPLILKTDMSNLRWDIRGVTVGIAVSLAVLLIYIAVLAGYGSYFGRPLIFNKLSFSFILMQLLLVALPEEVFFRGYLQQQLGNTIKGVVVVSLLFALGHFVTLCLGGDHSFSVCSQAILTFFPSLVMGYLYTTTETLWASIIFHFLANLVYISVGLS
jgi:membrane protease YdiL (CAAX protease family)